MDPIQTLPMDQEDEQTQQLDAKASILKVTSSDSLGNFETMISMPKQMILINLISQHPALFNNKHDFYRNCSKKDELWSTISQRVGWAETYCKNKWKALRDQYCRELKKARDNPKASIKWKYFSHLEFLRPYALSRNYRQRIPKTLDDAKDYQEQDESSIQESNLISSVKTENWKICDNSSQMNDCSDVTSEIIIQLSQSKGKVVAEEEELQDDEDDDPIHTFLNIESYFEKELITMIKSEELIYNPDHESYRNAKVKTRTWEEISRKLKKTVRQCRLKWKALRDQYIREHKRLKYMAIKKPNNGKTAPRWKHYDELNFLEKYMRKRNEYNFVAIEKPIGHFDQGQMGTPNEDGDHEMTQYILGDGETSEAFTEGLYSRDSIEEQTSAYIQDDRTNDPPIDQEATRESLAPIAGEDDDEVGTFFKAVAMKIRKANMNAMAFTDLQIDILKAINSALRNES